jgi:signal transduction histidine kinase
MVLLAGNQRQRFTADALSRRWVTSIGLAAAVGLAYFLAAQLSLGLLIQPGGVAVFWPAAGISSGALIAQGSRARWPVAIGTMAATIAANLMGDRNIWASTGFGLCNAAEALITAGLIQRYFGTNFRLDKLRQVLGLLAAAVAGTLISGIGGAVAFKLFHSSTVPMLTTWRQWFASDGLGIVAVAPLIIGLAAAVRERPPRNESINGVAALAMLAAMTGIIISLPEEPWKTVVPSALLFPLLFWLAARCRPVFAAAGVFIVSLTIVWATIVGIGHFGNTAAPIYDRILEAQAVILVVALVAFVLSALFAERRESEARLAHANLLLEHERDNKLMNVEAVAASIAHEIRQPLSAIAMNSDAALQFLAKIPPNYDEVRAALSDIISDGQRTNEVLEGIRGLFRKVDQNWQRTDINEIVHSVLHLLRRELKDRDVATHINLTSELPFVGGNRSQLQQVLVNLVRNALEAMANTTDRTRVLRVRTELRGRGSIAVAVEDSGPGIDPNQIDGIFDAFSTTKAHGMGLGLAICRMIIQRHGGQLTVSSDRNRGTLFQFVLPAEITEMPTAFAK